MKPRHVAIKVHKKTNRIQLVRNIAAIVLFIVVAVALFWLLTIMQNRVSEYRQKDNSEKILADVILTLQDNSDSVEMIENEFDSMNQNLIITLSNYLTYSDFLNEMRAISATSGANVAADEMSKLFVTLRDGLHAGTIYLIDDVGNVLVGSEAQFNGRNIKEAFGEVTNRLTQYKTDANGKVLVNGTASYDENGTRQDAHVETGNYYTYSTLLASDGEKSYYLLTSIPTSLLDSEISNLKRVEDVLKGVTVGKDGFLFAIDHNTGKFIYYDDNTTNLSGEYYADYGLSSNIEQSDFAGYETINGTTYYCVTKEFDSEVLSSYTIIAAAESKSSLLDRNLNVIAFSGIAFVLVSALVAGYALILRRDMANRMIIMQERFLNDYKDDIRDGKFTYTDEEILERTEMRLLDAIQRQTDPRFKRFNIGTRSRKGAQMYISLFILKKLLPVIILGLVLVFGISFFSQTLMSLEDVTTMSETSINDIPMVINQTTGTKSAIQTYINKQYISTASLIASIFEESPQAVYEHANGDPNAYRLFRRLENGEREYLKDMYGNDMFSNANSQALQIICNDNRLDSLYVFDEDGNVVSTNTDQWYYTLSKDENSQSYPFWDVVDGRIKNLAQEPMENDVLGEVYQYIGSTYNYYTYLGADGSTCYASKSDYESYLEGDWTGSEITMHRGMVQIGIDRSKMSNLFKITSLDYILGGMKVYGSDSFYLAFDNSDDHVILYSPVATSIGKTSAAVGLTDSAFTGSFNGFQEVNGVKYYQSIRSIGNYFISTAIPVESLYGARNRISLLTLAFSAVFIVFIAVMYALSTDKMDRDYVDSIRTDASGYRTDNYSFFITTPSGRRKRTSSIASRYEKVGWDAKSPEQKLSALMLVMMTIASAFILIALLLAITNGSSSSIFTYIFRGNWDKGWNIFAITEAIMVMIMILTITKLVQVSVRSFCGTLGARIETTGNLLVSVLKYGGLIGGAFYCLHLFGFNTTNLITSAGILSIVIGLGAQSLISDIIAGIFIVFEGEFRVGDIVTIGDFRGIVLEIGLRTTKIEEASKNIKIFNNSSISGVINMTKESSFAAVIMSIEYGESIERVEKILKNSFPKIRKKLPEIIDGPFYMGVESLGESSVDLRIHAKCAEKDRLQLVRDLRREFYLLFNKNNINIPFPQVTMSYLNESDHSETGNDEDQISEDEKRMRAPANSEEMLMLSKKKGGNK
ncbi:MAG: mechanosensitive ion channel family protein [Sphaerochaetaceae bacterium]|nr:mechanosensitive ion channel family protein [Sphaerochaetaceae bacterium]